MSGNPYHDRRGRFTSASGSSSGATTPDYGRGRPNTGKSLPYSVIWFEGDHGNKQEKQFATYDEAKAWAHDNIDPMNNGAVMPNVAEHLYGDGDVYDNRPYQSGLYSSGNKFAVIVDNPRK